jgi:hypothetical protein
MEKSQAHLLAVTFSWNGGQLNRWPDLDPMKSET